MALSVGQFVLIWPAALLNGRDVDQTGKYVSTLSKIGSFEKQKREELLGQIGTTAARITALQDGVKAKVPALASIGGYSDDTVDFQELDRYGVSFEYGEMVGGSFSAKGSASLFFAGSNTSNRETHAEEAMMPYPELSSTYVDTNKFSAKLDLTKTSNYSISATTSFATYDHVDVDSACDGSLGSASTVPAAITYTSVGSGDSFRGMALDLGENWGIVLKANLSGSYSVGDQIFTAGSGQDATTGTYASGLVDKEWDDALLIKLNANIGF